jgi:predicted small secreted protein
MVKEKLATALVALMLLSGGVALSACNTTQGVGKDIEATGDAIEEAAEDAQN